MELFICAGIGVAAGSVDVAAQGRLFFDIAVQYGTAVSLSNVHRHRNGYFRACGSPGLDGFERVAFIDWLAANPDAGDVIPGSGGCRKVNAAARGSFISIAWRAARWLLMVYVKAKFDNLPVSFLKQLREAIDHG